MFIEKKDSGLYLAKKSFGKKFLVKIFNNNVTKEVIEELTQKEFNFVFSFESYNNFLNEIYNKDLLETIVLKSKLLHNYIEIMEMQPKIIQCNIKFENEVINKGIDGEGWLKYIFPKKFIYNSNNIEGSKIPEDEVERIINNKKYKHKVKNEIQEVENSINSWKFLNDKFIFNEVNIKKLYHILTKSLLQENGEKYPRGFKKISNIVNNSITTTPEKVSQEINNLINWYKGNKRSIFPLQLAFDFHLKYEQIHPFENGNGRTGRFLMNKILIQNGMLPIIVFTENKQSYFNAIASCNSGNKKKYYKFMLDQYKKTLDEYRGFI